jgi:hypothetical protein
MSEIEVKSTINLRKAAFIVKELRAILNNFESETVLMLICIQMIIVKFCQK